MRDSGRRAVDLHNFVIFVVFKVGKPFHDNVQWPPIVVALRSGALIVLEAARSLDTEKVRQAAFVIERVIGGVGQNLLLLGGIGRWCLSLAWAEEQQGESDKNGGAWS